MTRDVNKSDRYLADVEAMFAAHSNPHRWDDDLCHRYCDMCVGAGVKFDSDMCDEVVALVAEREQAATLAERERCAKLADDLCFVTDGIGIASAIRGSAPVA